MNSTLKPVLRRCALVFFDDILIYYKTLSDHLQHLQEVVSVEEGPMEHQEVKVFFCSTQSVLPGIHHQ